MPLHRRGSGRTINALGASATFFDEGDPLMPLLPVLFADQVYDYAKPYLEKLFEVLPLPEKSELPLLENNIPAYVMVGIGVLFLLVFLVRLLTLRIFRALFALLATVLVSYYPVAYAFHYWWFNYQAPTMEGREAEAWESFITENWARTDYIIMAVGGVLGLLILWLSRVRRKKDYGSDEAGAQPQAQGRPAQKNPFDFGG
jgi:hypothetical protein